MLSARALQAIIVKNVPQAEASEVERLVQDLRRRLKRSASASSSSERPAQRPRLAPLPAYVPRPRIRYSDDPFMQLLHEIKNETDADVTDAIARRLSSLCAPETTSAKKTQETGARHCGDVEKILRSYGYRDFSNLAKDAMFSKYFREICQSFKTYQDKSFVARIPASNMRKRGIREDDVFGYLPALHSQFPVSYVLVRIVKRDRDCHVFSVGLNLKSVQKNGESTGFITFKANDTPVLYRPNILLIASSTTQTYLGAGSRPPTMDTFDTSVQPQHLTSAVWASAYTMESRPRPSYDIKVSTEDYEKNKNIIRQTFVKAWNAGLKLRQ